jgi:hypothetical protein
MGVHEVWTKSKYLERLPRLVYKASGKLSIFPQIVNISSRELSTKIKPKSYI